MHGGSIVVDGHMDTALRMLDDGADLGACREAGHADLPRRGSTPLSPTAARAPARNR